jgi:hypothetical protein
MFLAVFVVRSTVRYLDANFPTDLAVWEGVGYPYLGLVDPLAEAIFLVLAFFISVYDAMCIGTS